MMQAVPLLAALLAASPPPTHAEGITFDQALGLAAETPAVAGAQRALEVKREGDGRIPSLAANPNLFAQPGASPTDPTPKFEGQFGITQPLNLAGLSSARRRAARTEEDVLREEARAVALARRLDAARAWIDLWAAESALVLNREEFAIASDLSSRTHRAAAAAAVTRAEAADADTYEAEARLLALSVEGEVTDLGFNLARAVGRAGGKSLLTTGDLPVPRVPDKDRWPALIQAAGALPVARAARLTSEAERARAVEARAARGLELQLGAIYQRDNEQRNVFFGNVGVTVPLFERGQRESATLEAASARVAGEAEDLARQASTELARAFHEVEHTGEVLDELTRGVVPAAEEAARLRAGAVGAADITMVEVLLSRRTLAAARGREVRARAAHAWARVKVALLLAQLPPEARP